MKKQLFHQELPRSGWKKDVYEKEVTSKEGEKSQRKLNFLQFMMWNWHKASHANH